MTIEQHNCSKNLYHLDVVKIKKKWFNNEVVYELYKHTSYM